MRNFTSDIIPEEDTAVYSVIFCIFSGSLKVPSATLDQESITAALSEQIPITVPPLIDALSAYSTCVSLPFLSKNSASISLPKDKTDKPVNQTAFTRFVETISIECIRLSSGSTKIEQTSVQWSKQKTRYSIQSTESARLVYFSSYHR